MSDRNNTMDPHVFTARMVPSLLGVGFQLIAIADARVPRLLHRWCLPKQAGALLKS